MKSRGKKMFCAALFIATVFACQNTTFAGDSSSPNLTSVLPDDVLFFATTSGGDILKPEFEKTILGRIWNDPNVKTFYQTIQQSVLQKAQQQPGGSEAANVYNTVKSMAALIASRPIIIGAAQKTTQQGPPVYGFAFIDAGPKKGQIASVLTNLEAKAGEGQIVDVNVGSFKLHGPKDAGGIPGYWGWIGNYLVFAINDGQGLAIKYLQGNTSRQTQTYIEQTAGAKDLLAIYISVDKGLNLLKTVAAAEGQQDKYALVDTVLGQLGVNKIKTITTRTSFEGSGIVMDELVEIPQPRTGLFACLKTINLDMLNMVSANATNVSVVNIDIAGIYDTVMTTVKSVAGSNFQQIEQGITQLETQTGVKIRQGLLESLNGKMVSYNLPGGTSLQSLQGGFVIIAGLKNAQLWQDSIAALGKFATAASNGTVQVSSQEQNGRTLNTFAITPLALAQIIPTWTIVGENVVIGSNPTICTSAADLITPGGKPVTIRSSESFKKATENLPSNLISFQYTDSKVQAAQMMTALQQLWPVATMYVAQQGGITLPLVLPNLSNIIKDVTPSIQYSYFDQKGLHSYYKGAGIEPGLAAIAGGAIGAGVLLPAIAKTRQTADRMKTQTNLSAIGKAMLNYANDNQDEYPPNLLELAKASKLDPKVFESQRKPANFDGPSFLYVAGQTTSYDMRNILVYENPAFCTDNINVLFLDGHSDSMTKNNFLDSLKATYQRLHKPMPEITFKN